MKLSLNTITIIAILTINLQTNANIVNMRIYCADNNGNWNWLKNDNNIYETLNGYWKTGVRSCEFNMIDYQSDVYTYFVAQRGEEDVLKLADACRKKFETLVTPYAYYAYDTSSWFPIASNDNRILNSIITIKTTLPTTFIPVKNNINFVIDYPSKLFITQRDISNSRNCYK